MGAAPRSGLPTPGDPTAGLLLPPTSMRLADPVRTGGVGSSYVSDGCHRAADCRIGGLATAWGDNGVGPGSVDCDEKDLSSAKPLPHSRSVVSPWSSSILVPTTSTSRCRGTGGRRLVPWLITASTPLGFSRPVGLRIACSVLSLELRVLCFGTVEQRIEGLLSHWHKRGM